MLSNSNSLKHPLVIRDYSFESKTYADTDKTNQLNSIKHFL